MVGNDVLFGEGQDDDLIGGYGNDWISGGTGDDGVSATTAGSTPAGTATTPSRCYGIDRRQTQTN